jgi:hypothetical protein
MEFRMEVKPAAAPAQAQVAIEKKALASEEQVTKKVVEDAADTASEASSKKSLAIA